MTEPEQLVFDLIDLEAAIVMVDAEVFGEDDLTFGAWVESLPLDPSEGAS